MYQRQLMRFFKETVPEHVRGLDDATLLRVIGEGIRKARRHGLETGQGIVRFVGLCLLIDPEFDQQPAVRQFLSAPDLDPDFKIQVLSDLTSKRLRERSV